MNENKTTTEDNKKDETTFEERIASTNKAIDDVIAMGRYWRERCLAAEHFIEKSPCDPDITKEQIEAFNLWQFSKRNLPA